jgi:hypothetical protein
MFVMPNDTIAQLYGQPINKVEGHQGVHLLEPPKID